MNVLKWILLIILAIATFPWSLGFLVIWFFLWNNFNIISAVSQRQVSSTRRGCGWVALVVFGLLFMLSVLLSFQACSSDPVPASTYRPDTSSYGSGSGGSTGGSYGSSSGYDESDYDWDGDGTLDYDSDAYGDPEAYTSDPSEQDELDAYVEDFLESQGIDPSAPVDDPYSW